ncbi:MAG: dTMP kinase [Acidobacteriota bacterium]|nr:dTMP kinase [Acidobacteriota bacterium]
MPFVTFEGVEGCGKSTQLARAAEALREARREVLETREPGGTAIGRKIRDILMDVGHRDLEPAAEWLLLEADRSQHVAQTLKPALKTGAFVLCDRYSDSTEAYQARGRGLDEHIVRLVDAMAREGLVPELTLLYDVDPGLGLERARRRDEGSGRFESAEMDFHERVRKAYLEIARREPGRVVVISADRPPDEVFSSTWSAISGRFGL